MRFWVYILTNKHNTTLYTGVTNNLAARIIEHRMHYNKKAFTAKYNVYKLVYYEVYSSIHKAIAREKFLKRKSRAYKLALIMARNPKWEELTPP